MKGCEEQVDTHNGTQEPPLWEFPLVAQIDTLVETVGHTTIGPSIGEVLVGIDVPRGVTKFPNNSYLQQHGEHLEERDVDEDVILEELPLLVQLETLLIP